MAQTYYVALLEKPKMHCIVMNVQNSYASWKKSSIVNKLEVDEGSYKFTFYTIHYASQ